jgi:hypothetical protein
LDRNPIRCNTSPESRATILAIDVCGPFIDTVGTAPKLPPVWIVTAMALGLLLGRLIRGLGAALSAVQVDGISLPIALGLLIMMYRCWPRSAMTATTDTT